MIPKPGKRKKKSKLQKKRDNHGSLLWKRKADKEWGRVIHLLNDKCLVDNEHCGGPLEAHHLISRGKVMTRHAVQNGVILCSNHHKWSNECSPHMAPIQFTEFLRVHYPEKIDFVMENRWNLGKPDYKEKFEILSKIL